ncbi:uncharacterized protein PV06_08661 [Exophiala oligosperma]|uniref:Serine/threonine-protein kinase Tel1 n=1 Tax=Exophiala oligosperma TaxID=215243 RepID=A0A0D2D6J7_9EURO|nr:uncharacterized protein PV06_08661 [Exophiala oligosperma]KIW38823.1 hypothetical protein PV06_08661 [Exophiala oligosperma]
MAEVKLIVAAIGKLEADTQRVRTEGLEALKSALCQGRTTSRINVLEDDVFHKIFELLYTIIAREKSAFTRAVKPTTKNNAASRLEVAAAAFRLVVEAGSSNVSFKTALSVLDHVVDTLPLSDGSFCKPLKTDYLKAFRSILEYSPHAEHMRPKNWQGYVDFVLEALSLGLEDDQVDDDLVTSRETSMASRSGLQLSIRHSQRSRRTLGKDIASYVEDLAVALKGLTSVTNAPVPTRSAAIAEVLISLLNSTTRGQEPLFEILNNIIFVSLTENVALIRSMLMELIPIIRRLWVSKSSLLREQMLITLFTCRYFFLSTSEPWPHVGVDRIEALMRTILSEYHHRNEREILHFDDMRPDAEGSDQPLRLRQFLPLRESSRALSCFMTLSVVSCLILGLVASGKSMRPEQYSEDTSRKRQKTQSPFDEVLQSAAVSPGQERLVSLQILLFLLDQPHTLDEKLFVGVSKLIPALTHEDGNVQTWTFLIFSRVLVSPQSTTSSSIDWLRVYEAAQGALSIPAAARAACQLLNVILETEVLGSALTGASLHNAVFGGSNNGPCLFTDTALTLLTTALGSGLFETGKLFEDFCLKTLSWLTARWTLPPTLDRLSNSQIAFHGRPSLLYLLLTSMCGSYDRPLPREDWSPSHPLWRASLIPFDDLDFLRYLLCLPPHEPKGAQTLGHGSPQIDSVTASHTTKAVIDFLNGRLSDFMCSWESIRSERGFNITSDIATILAVASTVATGVWTKTGKHSQSAQQDPSHAKSRDTIEAFTRDQSEDMRRLVTGRFCESTLQIYDKIVQSDDEAAPEAYQPVIELALRLTSLVTDQDTTSSDSKNLSDFEIMDIDTWDSQSSQRGQHNVSSAMRIDLPLCSDTSSLLTRNKVELITALQVIKSSRSLDPETASVVVDQILSLDPDSLLAARGAVKDFFGLNPGVTRIDAHRLLGDLAKRYMQDYRFERCEAALCFCLSTMQSLSRLWTTREETDDLRETALDIYDWFLNTALGKQIASRRVLLHITNLLDSLMRQNASFDEEELPSPRTSLLHILKAGNVTTKYGLGKKLTRIFEKYVLSQHEAIFDDIVENLPSDPDNKEGIAVRLHVIAQLGAHWHTVLRQATYHTFETVANVPSTMPMATACIAEMCTTLGLKSPRVLFGLFAPQIFYTWLSRGSLAQIPYLAFSYISLKELALDNIAELVGQIALRGSSHAEELAVLVEQEWLSLLSDHFPYAEAYTLASETSVPKQERIYDGSEKLIRKQLGSESYLRLLRYNLPEIVARLVITLQDDRAIDKSFEKNDETSALCAWQEMASMSDSNTQIPLSQQPSFRARCLLDELNYLYQRLDIQSTDVWTSALLIHVYRQLLERIYPALGSLHVCSIIRKIRIAVSLAGPVALEGYPLEMILHNLRPYLTMFECAEDTMAIYQYLLKAGKAYLNKNPSFIAGLGVAIFTSLIGFMGSSQDSTTQEIHFVSTMNKAQAFRSYLGDYLDSMSLAEGTEKARSTFQSLVQHAKAITSSGNSSKSSSEGSLLQVLLADRASEEPLLTNIHFDIAIGILCQHFQPATSRSDDILEDDLQAAQFSPILGTIVKRINLNQPFRIWTAEIIGRGHIMRGLRFNARREKSIEYPSDVTQVEPDQDAIHSYTSIVEFLLDLIWGSDFTASAYAEKTLQLIFSGMPDRSQDDVLQQKVERDLIHQLKYKHFPCPAIPLPQPSILTAERLPSSTHENGSWASDIVAEISDSAAHDPVLSFLKPIALALSGSADILLPFAAHLVLLREINAQQTFKDKLSHGFTSVFHSGSRSPEKPRRLALQTLLYLQRCRFPNETNITARNSWLDIDLGDAAIAAAECRMWHEALLLLELQHSYAGLQSGRSSRRSFASAKSVPGEVVAKVYENVDDPDFFYGKKQEFDLAEVVSKMTHEGASQTSLSLHSAMLDTRLRMGDQGQSFASIAQVTASSLSAANMQGISEAVRQYYEDSGNNTELAMGLLPNSDWDVQPMNRSITYSKDMSTWLQDLYHTTKKQDLIDKLDQSLLLLIDDMEASVSGNAQTSDILTHLAIRGEIKQIMLAKSPEDLEVVWARIEARDERVKLVEFERLSPILDGRESSFAAMRRNVNLQAAFSLSPNQALRNEVRAARHSLELASKFDVPQFCLNRTLYLSELNQVANQSGLEVDVAVRYDLARTLWSQDETAVSIGILQKLKERDDTAKQAIPVTRAAILTELGHRIAEARLEKPDEIISRYLIPSFEEIRGHENGSEAGRVYHNFASFCDTQLQDTDNLDDFTRISKIRDRKDQEVRELEQMYKSSRDDRQKKQLKIHLDRARTWFKIDDEEWKRVRSNREELILNCLENYLLSMKASDDYPNDTLRLLALWLNQAESREANKVVGKHLPGVPTIRFAPLVNQLSSRLLDIKDDFQKNLMDLMFRICSDHPYHSLYQLFAASKSKALKQDEVAVSRNHAAIRLSEIVNKKSVSAAIWVALHNSCIQFHRVASESLSEKEKRQGSKIQLRKLQSGQKLENVLSEAHTRIAPPTLNIPLRPDHDYSSVPTFVKFDPMISIAGGLSNPKIVTMTASDGQRYKMLLKSGNDDLRQDAIMEQVFQQVSDLLKDHRATRQRNLDIRTYKVIPLTTNSGIIEFVKDTLPLHDYLLPAHERFFPKDYKPNKCRKEIAEVQTKGLEQRLRTYRTVTANFHPVMRFFFMERFPDPDDWFYKRLNYSRSMAAVSILGHVLGLGDRHGHNILLDENSGEVVHIDLGVAFEAGRVLPIPEVVPFRLTRDLVDGMGLTGVEGVFRRCCNFTLEALRVDQESIMTILDVLRYDPLHTWSISPLRLQRMQENNEQAEATAAGAGAGASVAAGVDGGGGGMLPHDLASRREANEPSEADRALTIVAKKLGKALSVEATVNELIRQATDERNLAALFCGWAAYA